MGSRAYFRYELSSTYVHGCDFQVTRRKSPSALLYCTICDGVSSMYFHLYEGPYTFGPWIESSYYLASEPEFCSSGFAVVYVLVLFFCFWFRHFVVIGSTRNPQAESFDEEIPTSTEDGKAEEEFDASDA